MMILEQLSIFFFLFYSILILFVGISGIYTFRKNLVTVLISLEIMFLSIHLNFLVFSLILDNMTGYIFSIFILAISGSEISIGLAIIILVYRLHNRVDTEFLVFLKG
jgi:NADH-quinone oxidoreductase subunit K